MAICQPVQAVCKTKQTKQESVAEGSSGILHILFIPAGGRRRFLTSGLFIAVVLRVNTLYSLYI